MVPQHQLNLNPPAPAHPPLAQAAQPDPILVQLQDANAQLQTAIAGSTAAYHQAEARCREGNVALIQANSLTPQLSKAHDELFAAWEGIVDAYKAAVARSGGQISYFDTVDGPGIVPAVCRVGLLNPRAFPYCSHKEPSPWETGVIQDLVRDERIRQERYRVQQAVLQAAVQNQPAQSPQRFHAELQLSLGNINDAYQNAESRCKQVNTLLENARRRNSELERVIKTLTIRIAQATEAYNKEEAAAAKKVSATKKP